MALTVNHQTNDISATSGSVTLDGSAVGGGFVVRAPQKTFATYSKSIGPSDLGYLYSATLAQSNNDTIYCPWVAPANGAISHISYWIAGNSVSSSATIAVALYSNGTVGPYQRLATGTIDPNGQGTGEKAIGVSQAVTAGTLYWLAAGHNGGYNNITTETYRRNSFLPMRDAANDDYSYRNSGITMPATISSINTSTAYPIYLTARYA